MKTTTFLSIVLILVGLIAAPGLTADKPAGPSFYDPLLYADLIIRGTITATSEETIKFGEWGASFPTELAERDLAVDIVTFRVKGVLKGVYEKTEMDVIVWRGRRGELAAGKEHIVCLQFNQHVRNGMYFPKDNENGVFTRSGDLWIRQGDRERFALGEIEKRIATTKLESIARDAEIVVVGTILSVDSSPFVGPESQRGMVTEYTMRAESLMKGSVEGEELVFKMLTSGLYSPSWRTYVPPEINQGEKWYAFLKSGDVGYYPFAGANGLLKVDGDALIYGNRVKYQHAKHVVDRMVTKEARNED